MLYLRVYLQAIEGEMSNRQFDMDMKLGEKSELRVSIWQNLKTSMDEIDHFHVENLMSELSRSFQNSKLTRPPQKKKNSGTTKPRKSWKVSLQILKENKDENWIMDFIV